MVLLYPLYFPLYFVLSSTYLHFLKHAKMSGIDKVNVNPKLWPFINLLLLCGLFYWITVVSERGILLNFTKVLYKNMSIVIII